MADERLEQAVKDDSVEAASIALFDMMTLLPISQLWATWQ